MQYPIIDNLIYAYLRNGWTGLDLQYGKNLFDENTVYNQFLQEDGTFSGPAAQVNDILYRIPDELLNMQLTFSAYVKSSTGTLPTNIRVLANINSVNRDGNYITSSTFQRSVITFTPISTNDYIKITYGSGGSNIIDFKDIQLEAGDIATNFEHYAPPTTDIKNRMKLPMIHYFPHPVVDAIISAADGQHTEEEKEILRHYLTPLGIGGI